MERANLKELAKKAIEAKDPEKFGSVAIGYLMLVNDFIGEFFRFRGSVIVGGARLYGRDNTS